MSNDRLTDDPYSEGYDLSESTRGAYSGRLSTADEWYQGAVAADEARWLAECLLQIQRLERELVTYFSLLGDPDLAAAGERVGELLESADEGSLGRLASDLQRSETVSDLAQRLWSVVSRRRWLVHGSYLEEARPSSRAVELRELAEEAQQLAAQLTELLRRRFVDEGMSADEFERRAEAVRLGWPRTFAA